MWPWGWQCTVQCLAWYTLTTRLQFLWQCKQCSIRILVLITPPSSEPSRISIEWAGQEPLQPHNIARPADWAQLRALASSPCRGRAVRHLHVTAIADTPESRLPLILAKMEFGTVNAKSYLFHLKACAYYFFIIRHIIISACICQFERVGHHHRSLKYEIIIPSFVRWCPLLLILLMICPW